MCCASLGKSLRLPEPWFPDLMMTPPGRDASRATRNDLCEALASGRCSVNPCPRLLPFPGSWEHPILFKFGRSHRASIASRDPRKGEEQEWGRNEPVSEVVVSGSVASGWSPGSHHRTSAPQTRWPRAGLPSLGSADGVDRCPLLSRSFSRPAPGLPVLPLLPASPPLPSASAMWSSCLLCPFLLSASSFRACVGPSLSGRPLLTAPATVCLLESFLGCTLPTDGEARPRERSVGSSSGAEACCSLCLGCQEAGGWFVAHVSLGLRVLSRGRSVALPLASSVSFSPSDFLIFSLCCS